jgi:hypothetical protein
VDFEEIERKIRILDLGPSGPSEGRTLGTLGLLFQIISFLNGAAILQAQPFAWRSYFVGAAFCMAKPFAWRSHIVIILLSLQSLKDIPYFKDRIIKQNKTHATLRYRLDHYSHLFLNHIGDWYNVR